MIIKELLEEMRLNRIEMNEKQNEMNKKQNLLLNKIELMENLNNKLENEINEIKGLTGSISNSYNENTSNSNNIIQNNNTLINNINIVAFGKEKLDELIGDEECKKILFRGFEAVPQLIENVHFNKERPEYHNCYIPNLRDKYAIVFDGDNWKRENTVDVIETLTENNTDYLERKFEDFYDLLNEQTKKKFKKFLNEQDSAIVKKRYNGTLKLILYNKKDTVINTRTKFDKQNKLNMLEK